MKKQKTLLEFMCYSPQIYSGLDRYNVIVAEKMVQAGYLPVFVYSDSVECVADIRHDLERAGARVEVIGGGGRLKTVLAILVLLIKYKPTIVHTHFVNFIKVFTACLSRAFGCRFYVSFHSTISMLQPREYSKQKGYLKRFLLFSYYKGLIYSSTRIFTVSEEVRREFLAFASCRSKKVEKLYLGVDFHDHGKGGTELRESLGLPTDKVLLCNISAFEELKGIDTLCRAVSRLKHEYGLKNFSFCHIGGLRVDNEINLKYKNSILVMVRELDIEENVFWLGKRNDAAEILSAFDVYVHPSRVEGLGLACVEAASHGLPIVASRVGGIPEIVVNEVNGCLVEPGSDEQLASCIYRLITDEPLRREMGAASLDIAKERFDLTEQTDRLVNYYTNPV